MSHFFFQTQREILIPTLMITLIVLRQKSLVRNAPKSKLGICIAFHSIFNTSFLEHCKAEFCY